MMYDQTLSKIEEQSAKVGIIGLGYVGLPLAVGLAKVGYQVTGVDANSQKVEILNKGVSYIPDVPSAEVAQLVGDKLLQGTTDYQLLKEVDVIFICVPTPFDSMKAPDLIYVRQAAEGIAPNLRA